MNKLPSLKKKCPECEGNKVIPTGMAYQRFKYCPTCDYKGEVCNYLTPEQWEDQTGTKMLDSDPVWVRSIRTNIWDIHQYGERPYLYSSTFIVARLGQPAPPADYKPAKQAYIKAQGGGWGRDDYS